MRATSASLSLLVLLAAAPCHGQGAAKGADHYEVTIAPPSRPGSAPAMPPTLAPGTEAAMPADPASVPSGAASGAASGATSGAAPAASLGATPGAAAQPQAAQPTGPLRTLQVGAYRQRRSAEAMGERLGDSYGEVQVVEVESGGEKLYRVRVGKLPAGAALTALKSRLLAAGFPAFEVELPETR